MKVSIVVLKVFGYIWLTAAVLLILAGIAGTWSRMKVWIVVLKVFGYIWLTAAVLLILAGIAGIWMEGGFSAVQELLSPFNVVNWIVTVITLAPGVGALAWAEKLKAKSPVTHCSDNPVEGKGRYMAEVITYKPGAYCQLKLASRERVLISCAQTGIKIMTLALGGLIPTRTIADWPVSQLATAVHIFADESNPSQHPLEAIKNKLMSCSSIREVEQLCAGK